MNKTYQIQNIAVLIVPILIFFNALETVSSESKYVNIERRYKLPTLVVVLILRTDSK